MKKHFLKILATAVLLTVISSQIVFAAEGLTLVSSFPENNETGLQISNQMARLVFNHDVIVEENKDCFKVIGPDGKKEPIMVLEQADQPERINLLFERELEQDGVYKIVIDEALTDTEGNVLGEEVTITFTTKKAGQEMIITSVMMGLMFAGIIVMTIREQTKQQKTQQAQKGEKVNPYKEARKEAEKILSERKKERAKKVDSHMKQSAQKKKNPKKK